MYNNDRFNNNSRFGSRFGSGIGMGLKSGGIGSLMGGTNNSNGQMNSSPTIGGNSPEAKARLGITNDTPGVDRFGMDASFQKRHFADLAAADKMYADSANDIADTDIDQQEVNNRMQLGTNAQNYNAQTLASKQEKPKPTVYDPNDYNTWFDDM